LDNPRLNLKIWPFSGSLTQCCQQDNIVDVETYRAEFYSHPGLSFSFITSRSKRRRTNQQNFSPHLLALAAKHNLELDDTLVAEIHDGFGDQSNGEDRFDAVVGLYGMIDTVIGNHPASEPAFPALCNIEGWIFGQTLSVGDTSYE
jgi:hypothetical protein